MPEKWEDLTAGAAAWFRDMLDRLAKEGPPPLSLARFLQYDSVTIVISRGYGDAIAVWHQALGGCQTPSLFGAN